MRRTLVKYLHCYREVYQWACDAPVTRWIMSGLLMPGSRFWQVLAQLRATMGASA
jgi:hypothetical protein